jgi:hypothetical protein
MQTPRSAVDDSTANALSGRQSDPTHRQHGEFHWSLGGIGVRQFPTSPF